MKGIIPIVIILITSVILLGVVTTSYSSIPIIKPFQTWWYPSTPDFVINETLAHYDLGIKVNTTTITDRYNITDNTTEFDFPYADKDPSLVAYYRMEGNGNDETGFRNAVVTGVGTTNVTGKFDNAYSFNGTANSNYLTASSFAFLNGTACFWYKPDRNVSTEFYWILDSVYAGANVAGFTTYFYQASASSTRLYLILGNGTTDRKSVV